MIMGDRATANRPTIPALALKPAAGDRRRRRDPYNSLTDRPSIFQAPKCGVGETANAWRIEAPPGADGGPPLGATEKIASAHIDIEKASSEGSGV